MQSVSELEEAREDSPQVPSEGTTSAIILILVHKTYVLGIFWRTSDFQNWKNSCCFKQLTLPIIKEATMKLKQGAQPCKQHCPSAVNTGCFYIYLDLLSFLSVMLGHLQCPSLHFLFKFIPNYFIF